MLYHGSGLEPRAPNHVFGLPAGPPIPNQNSKESGVLFWGKFQQNSHPFFVGPTCLLTCGTHFKNICINKAPSVGFPPLFIYEAKPESKYLAEPRPSINVTALHADNDIGLYDGIPFDQDDADLANASLEHRGQTGPPYPPHATMRALTDTA